MGFWGRRSTRCPAVYAPRHGGKEVVVARRERQPSTILEVRVMFEPSRVSPAYVVQAYEHVVPLTCRMASGASHTSQAGHRTERAEPTQRVGGRPAS